MKHSAKQRKSNHGRNIEHPRDTANAPAPRLFIRPSSTSGPPTSTDMNHFTLSELVFAVASLARVAIVSRLSAAKDLLFADAHGLLPR
jgi:hypothetical protein